MIIQLHSSNANSLPHNVSINIHSFLCFNYGECLPIVVLISQPKKQTEQRPFLAVVNRSPNRQSGNLGLLGDNARSWRKYRPISRKITGYFWALLAFSPALGFLPVREWWVAAIDRGKLSWSRERRREECNLSVRFEHFGVVTNRRLNEFESQPQTTATGDYSSIPHARFSLSASRSHPLTSEFDLLRSAPRVWHKANRKAKTWTKPRRQGETRRR